jgi:hypothetical protein
MKTVARSAGLLVAAREIVQEVKFVDNPKSHTHHPEPFAPLTFSLNQAAALCGVAVRQLTEWAHWGYVRSSGAGDDRRFDRHALRQILNLRDSMRAGPAAPPDSATRRSTRRAQLQGPDAPSRRPEEFAVPPFPMNDARLLLHAEVYFALNGDASHTAGQLAERLSAEPRQMSRILDSMQRIGVVRRLQDGEFAYGPGRSRLHGPNPREQRVRAVPRRRLPAHPR